MKKVIFLWIIWLGCFLISHVTYSYEIGLYQNGLATYYTNITVAGLKAVVMFDTGAGYTTINQSLLDKLIKADEVELIGELTAVLADHSQHSFPIYTVSTLTMGNCVLHDIEVAVFPGETRMLLGLTVLTKISPFTFHTDPPSLSFTNCPQ